MIFFDKELFYVNNPTVEERKQIAKVVTSSEAISGMKIMNCAVNIAVPLVVCVLTKCNLIAAACAFILTDMILCAIDNYIAVLKPHNEARNGLLSSAQNNLKAIIQRRDIMKGEVGAHRKSRCRSCDEMDCNNCQTQEMIDELKDLETFIEFETDWIDKKLRPIKEAEMQEDQRPAKDYTDKKEYFVTMEAKIAYFITSHNIACLKPVLSAIDELMDTLDSKPNGYEMVPTTLYIYMDELQKILGKMVTLSKDQATKYDYELERVSTALSRNINKLVERVRNMETADIEVGLSVLIKELEGEVN